MDNNGTVGAMPNAWVSSLSIMLPLPAGISTHQNTCSGWWHDPWIPWRKLYCQRAGTSASTHCLQTPEGDGRWRDCSLQDLQAWGQWGGTKQRAPKGKGKKNRLNSEHSTGGEPQHCLLLSGAPLASLSQSLVHKGFWGLSKSSWEAIRRARVSGEQIHFHSLPSSHVVCWTQQLCEWVLFCWKEISRHCYVKAAALVFLAHSYAVVALSPQATAPSGNLLDCHTSNLQADLVLPTPSLAPCWSDEHKALFPHWHLLYKAGANRECLCLQILSRPVSKQAEKQTHETRKAEERGQ